VWEKSNLTGSLQSSSVVTLVFVAPRPFAPQPWILGLVPSVPVPISPLFSRSCSHLLIAQLSMATQRRKQVATSRSTEGANVGISTVECCAAQISLELSTGHASAIHGVSVHCSALHVVKPDCTFVWLHVCIVLPILSGACAPGKLRSPLA
jgi:hypothetical protein